MPLKLADTVEEKHAELIKRLADADEEIEKLFLMEDHPMEDHLRAAIWRQAVA